MSHASTRCTLATMYGVGLVKKAPGTAGSLVAALLAALALHSPHGWGIILAGTVLFSLLGLVSANRYMQAHGTAHDPKEIVVDELAGQWGTYAVWYLWIVGMTGGEVAPDMLDVDTAPIFLLLGFVLFRFFDILKPWPISWIDRRVEGGLGVMLDDLLAAFFSGSVLYGLYLYWPVFFGTLEEMP